MYDDAPPPLSVTIEPAHTVAAGAAEAVTAGSALTVIVKLLDEEAHGELEMVQLKTYEPAPPAGVNVDVFDAVLLNCEARVLGPLTTVHAPVPVDGALAASVADEPMQID